MLTAKVLNARATVNSFKEIGAVEFIAGTKATLILRLFDTDEENRFIPATGSTLNVILNNTDGTTETVAATLNADDRSFATVEISAVLTADLQGGNIELELTEPTGVTKGIVYNPLQKVTMDF